MAKKKEMTPAEHKERRRKERAKTIEDAKKLSPSKRRAMERADAHEKGMKLATRRRLKTEKG